MDWMQQLRKSAFENAGDRLAYSFLLAQEGKKELAKIWRDSPFTYVRFSWPYWDQDMPNIPEGERILEVETLGGDQAKATFEELDAWVGMEERKRLVRMAICMGTLSGEWHAFDLDPDERLKKVKEALEKIKKEEELCSSSGTTT